LIRALSEKVGCPSARSVARILPPANTYSPIAARNRLLLISAGHIDKTVNVGSTISAGGNALLIARQDLTATGATVSAGGTLNLAVGRNVTIANALDTDNRDVRSAEDHTWIRAITSDQTVVGSTISGAGGVAIVAGLSDASGSLAILGSSVTSQNGTVALQAAKDITIASVGEEHDSTRDSVHISSGFLSSSKTTTHDVVNTNSQRVCTEPSHPNGVGNSPSV
jgi:hypothetical protein